MSEAAPARNRSFLFYAPLVLFAALSLLFLFRLDSGDPSKVPSALIGSPVPQFELPPVDGLMGPDGPVAGFSTADLRKGGVSIVNVWASWCGPCRDEHPFLMELGKDDRFALYGLNYKDEPGNARRFLGRYEDPFDAVGADRKGRVGIDWGVYGVPETFVIGKDGHIAYKHVGPISERSLREDVMPAIEKALAAEG